MDYRPMRLLVLDVDGTLTDGAIYMGPDGEVCKRFSAKDGLGLKLLQSAGVEIAILTGRRSRIVKNRAAELGIARVVQGISEKPAALRQLAAETGVSLTETGYMGDDLNDLSAMCLCGVRACPADAAPEVREICQFVSDFPGGQGAVRQFCEAWLKSAGLWETVSPRPVSAQ